MFSSDLYKHEILLKFKLKYVCHSLPDTGFPFLQPGDHKEIRIFQIIKSVPNLLYEASDYRKMVSLWTMAINAKYQK